MLYLIRKVVNDKGVLLVSFAWLSFISENLILSHNREEIISRFGPSAYYYSYSLLSTISCGAIVYSYAWHCRGRGLPSPSKTVLRQSLSFITQSLGLIGFSQLAPKLQLPFERTETEAKILPDSTNINNGEKLPKVLGITLRCPIDFRASENERNQKNEFGIERITRHPVLWSIATTCLGSAISASFVPEIVALSFPLVWAIIGGAHTDYRHRRGWGGNLKPEKELNTSHVPFVAIFNGRQKWSQVYDEMKWTNAAIALSTASLLAIRRLR